jgi:hypothetical protein
MVGSSSVHVPLQQHWQCDIRQLLSSVPPMGPRGAAQPHESNAMLNTDTHAQIAEWFMG